MRELRHAIRGMLRHAGRRGHCHRHARDWHRSDDDDVQCGVRRRAFVRCRSPIPIAWSSSSILSSRRGRLAAASLVVAEYHSASGNRDIVRDGRVVHAIARFHQRPRRSRTDRCRSRFVRVLSRASIAPAAGRLFGPGDDTAVDAEPIALISARLWRTRFSGDLAALHDTIRVNDVPLAIAGVLPEGFTGLSGKAELWLSPPMAARLTYAGYLTTPQNFISVLARLKDTVALDGANAELSAIGPGFTGEPSRGAGQWSAVAVPIDETRVDPAVRRSAFVLLGGAACVLLIACVNVAILLLARARTRQREIAVRLALGASRQSLVRQLLTEGLLIAALAGATGTLLSMWGMDVVARAAPDVVPTGRANSASVASFGRPGLDARVLAFSLAVSLGTVLVFALAPALRASRPQLTTALKDDERGGGRRSRAQSLLVVSDVALASFLLAGSGVLIESFALLQAQRTGFVPDNVLTFWVRPPTSRFTYPEDGPRIIERLLARIQAVPDVASAAANRCTPFMGCSRSVIFFADRQGDTANPPVVGRHYASADYFRTLGIPLVSGRLITDADREGTPPVAVVNQAGARLFWPGENPIGKRVWFGTTTGPFSDRAHAVESWGSSATCGMRPSTNRRHRARTSTLPISNSPIPTRCSSLRHAGRQGRSCLR